MQAIDLAAALGLETELLDLVALLTGELGSNLVSHAQGGELLIRGLLYQGSPGVEVLSVDRGPGMDDVCLCLQDGFSTAGTLGTGLGVARKISDEFDVYSEPGQGTVVMSRIWSKAARFREVPFDSGTILTEPVPRARVRGRLLTRRDGRTTLSWPQPGSLPGLMDDALPPEPGLAAVPSEEADGRILILDDGFLDPAWTVEEFPEVLSHHPAILAGLIYREHAPPHGRMALRVLARGAPARHPHCSR
jgi:anti-sigma regulatory factor (Ser/Thr protein kinase)